MTKFKMPSKEEFDRLGTGDDKRETDIIEIAENIKNGRLSFSDIFFHSGLVRRIGIVAAAAGLGFLTYDGFKGINSPKADVSGPSINKSQVSYDVSNQPNNKSYQYEDDIENRHVFYNEEKEVNINDIKKPANVMVVIRLDDTYTLIDYESYTGIDWKRNAVPSYLDDEIDRIEIRRGDKSYTFDRDDINYVTIDGQAAKSILCKGTKYYNGLRTRIREGERLEYTQEHNKLEELFDEIDN